MDMLMKGKSWLGKVSIRKIPIWLVITLYSIQLALSVVILSLNLWLIDANQDLSGQKILAAMSWSPVSIFFSILWLLPVTKAYKFFWFDLLMFSAALGLFILYIQYIVYYPCDSTYDDCFLIFFCSTECNGYGFESNEISQTWVWLLRMIYGFLMTSAIFWLCSGIVGFLIWLRPELPEEKRDDGRGVSRYNRTYDERRDARIQARKDSKRQAEHDRIATEEARKRAIQEERASRIQATQ